MTHFIVTFRIKNDSTYQDRYDSFVKKASELADKGPWEETTSFLTFTTKNPRASADGLCFELYMGSEFNSATDTMVVIDLDSRTKATKGEIKYPSTLSACLGSNSPILLEMLARYAHRSSSIF